MVSYLHRMLLEYLLIEKYPDGLGREEFCPALFKRGLPNEYARSYYFEKNDEEVTQQLDDLNGLHKDAVIMRENKVDSYKNTRSNADLSLIALDIYVFCYYYEQVSKDLVRYEPGKGLIVREMPQQDGHGNILYNLENDKKFKFFPRHDKTKPVNWTSDINLLCIGNKLASYAYWEYPRGEQAFASEKNIYFTIANWFSRKFNTPFHEIYYEQSLEKSLDDIPIDTLRKLRSMRVPS